MSSLTKGTVKVDIRRDTASNFTTANPTLKAGEPAYETDTQKLKVGDGSTQWTSLAYVSDVSLPLTGGAVTGNVSFQSQLAMINSVTNKPLFILENTTNDQTGAHIKFLKDKGAAGAAGDVLGNIDFYGDDAGQVETQFASIHAEIDVATDGQESGELVLKVASHDGGLENALIATGGDVDAEVDVTIGNGAASLTTIAGDLSITGNDIRMPANANIEPSGHLSINVGASKEIYLTENSGTYTPTAANHAVPKHYLDANTYHFIKGGYYTINATKTYIPIAGNDDLRELTSPTGAGERVVFICPYDGSFEKVMVRSENACDSSIFGFHVANTGEVPSTTATQSVTVDMASIDTSYEFDFAAAGTNTFSKGNIIMFSFDPTSTPNDISFTIVLKFDVST